MEVTFREFLYKSSEGMNKKTMVPSFKMGSPNQKTSAPMPARSAPILDPNILGSKKNVPGTLKKTGFNVQLPNPVVFDKNKFSIQKTNFKKI